MSTSLKKACVFGNPIKQSKSPIIHSMFAKQFDFNLEYTKRLAEVDGFQASADVFFADSATIGANVTMPFKHDAMQWVDELSKQAQRAGAVNTIIRKGNRFVGDNTDGVGLVSDLKSRGVNLKQMQVLIIGAGGAAKGAIPALIDAGIKQVHIHNRSIEKAEQLVLYTNQYAQQKASLYDKRIINFDLIINATSLSLQNKVPDLPDSIFAAKPAIYDMVYLPQATVFMDKAQSMGCSITIDGLGMLVHQAAHSFYLWFGVQPETGEVYKLLRESS